MRKIHLVVTFSRLGWLPWNICSNGPIQDGQEPHVFLEAPILGKVEHPKT